jgi:hypothetical protein
MSKSFWDGFAYGFSESSIIFGPVILAFIIGLTLGSWSHPYEVCTKLHDTPEDIAECTWIRMNP